MKESKSVYKDDITKDKIVENEPVLTFYRPLVDIAYLPEHQTICITGDGFSRVQIRLTKEQLFNFVELVKSKDGNKGENI